MSIALKEALLNKGFKHHNTISKTYILLCLSNRSDYFINIIQEFKHTYDKKVLTIHRGISSISTAEYLFESIRSSFEDEDLKLARIREQASYQEKQGSHSGEDIKSQDRLIDLSKEDKDVDDVIKAIYEL